jgi:twinkle protein
MARRPDPAKPFLVGDSIGDILAEAGIALGRVRLSPGKSVKTLCPACNGGRAKEVSLSIKLDADSAGAAWHCFRGNCGGSSIVPGSGRIEGVGMRDEALRRRERPPVVRPVLHTRAEQMRPPALYEFFAAYTA